jgi:hypothetical protein
MDYLRPTLTLSSLPLQDQIPEVFRPVRFAVLLGVLIAVAFPEIVFGQSSFFFRDFGFFSYPLAHYQRECFWRGEIPLWNPLNNCGLPFLAQWNTMVLYPGSLFYLLLPLSWSLSVFCLLHQWLAGVGMYCLARRWTRSSWAASVAGIVFAFNGMTLNCLMGPAHMATISWMPWVVLGVESAWQRGGKALGVAVALGSMQMLAGGPEFVLLTWGILVCLALGELLPGPGAAFDRTWLLAARTLLLRLGLVIGLISGLTAVQWLPFLDLLAHSQRDAGFSGSGWAMPGTGWANLLVPLFHCFPGTQGVFFQDGQWLTSSYYSGVAPLLLACLAVGGLPSRRVMLLTIVAALGLLLALGENGFLFPWLKTTVPSLGFMRYPVKFVQLSLFAGPLLMAFSLVALQVPERVWPRIRVLWGIAALALVAMGGIIWFAGKYRMPWDEWSLTWKNALIRAGFLILIVAGLHQLARTKTETRRTLTQVSLLLLVWADLMTHVPWQNPSVPRAAMEPGIVHLSPSPELGQSRVMTSPFAENLRHVTSVTNAMQLFLGYRLGLFCNCNLLEGIAKVNGFYALYPGKIDVVVARLYSSDLPTMAGLCNFLGVSQVTAAGKLMDWEYRPAFLPLVTAGQQPVFMDDSPTLQALQTPLFNATNTVFLPPEAKAVVSCRGKETVRLTAYRFASHRLSVEVEAPASSMLVVAQSYYHNWHAYVDHRSVALWRANYAFQALEVPPGHHRVELVYEDRAFRLGMLMSLGSALCSFVGWRKVRETRG